MWTKNRLSWQIPVVYEKQNTATFQEITLRWDSIRLTLLIPVGERHMLEQLQLEEKQEIEGKKTNEKHIIYTMYYTNRPKYCAELNERNEMWG